MGHSSLQATERYVKLLPPLDETPTRRSASTPTSVAGLPTRDTAPPGCDTYAMREGATLKLDSGEQVRVDVDRDDLEHEEIVVRRTPEPTPSHEKLLAWIDHHLATAEPHPAGTTDRFLEADRERPY